MAATDIEEDDEEEELEADIPTAQHSPVASQPRL